MSRAPIDLRSLARSHTETAVRVLAGIMEQPSSADAARVRAAEALLDRGWGKPAQPISSDPDSSIIVNIIQKVRAPKT